MKLTPLVPLHSFDLPEAVGSMAWSPDGSQLAIGTLEGIIEIVKGSERRALAGHPMGTLGLQWWTNQLLVSGGADGKVRAWDLEKGSESIFDLKGNRAWVEKLSLSSDRKLLAIAAGSKVSLWESPEKCLRELAPMNSTVTDLMWQSQGRLLAGIANGQVYFWRAGSSAPQREFTYGSSLLTGKWSPRGDWFAVGCQDASIHLWITASGEDLYMSGYPRKIRELDWHPGGRWLAVGGSQEITVWDFSGAGPAGTTPKQLAGHGDFITQLAYSPDGKWLGSTGEDGFFLLWEAEGSRFPMRGFKVNAPLTHIAWNPVQPLVAVGGENGQISILSVAV